MNFTVSSDFPAGTAGVVVFRRKEWLTDASGILIPPSDVTATLAGSPPGIAQSLRASQEDGVSPDFTYEVFIRLTGHNEMKGTLFLTENCDLGTAITFTTPADPQLFVTRAEYEFDLEAAGNPASQEDLDALEAVVDGIAADVIAVEDSVTQETSDRIADVNAEQARAEAAEGVLDGRLDTAEADITAVEADIATLEAGAVTTLAEAKEEVLVIAVGDETTAITTGTAKVTFRMPFAMTVTAVRASLTTTSSSGTPTVDINEGGSTILSTKLTIDAGEKTSTTAATPAVISDGSLADDAEITIDVDVAGTDAAGLKVALIGSRA